MRVRCADVVYCRDINTAEQDQTDDARKTLTAAKPADDLSKVEVRNNLFRRDF